VACAAGTCTDRPCRAGDRHRATTGPRTEGSPWVVPAVPRSGSQG
jgi:hypothetical protein